MGTLRSLCDGSGKSRQIFQHMVRREDQQDRITVFHITGSRHGQRGSGDGRVPYCAVPVPADPAVQSLTLQGCGSKKALLFIADDYGRGQSGHGRKTLQRILEQRMTAQIHELLGILATGQGPQACTGAPAQDDGTDLHVVCSVYLETWRKKHRGRENGRRDFPPAVWRRLQIVGIGSGLAVGQHDAHIMQAVLVHRDDGELLAAPVARTLRGSTGLTSGT